MVKTEKIRLSLKDYDAAILDMDGVITKSVRAHMAAWKRMFDDYLRERAKRLGEEFVPFSDDDYYRYVDGKPRYDGARSFLESRGVHLPSGSPDDPPGKETVRGLGDCKNSYFLDYIKKNGVEYYPSTRDFIMKLKSGDKGVAAISASRNAHEVLEAAGVADLFPVVVGGVEADERHLKGKPAPDVFIEAARQLDVRPGRAIVIEDAISGVEAGRAGGFALVIGLNRSGRNAGLKDSGADIVVRDLSEIETG